MTLRLVLFVGGILQAAGFTVSNLQTDYLENPLGIDNPAPRFSWELVPDDGARGLRQATFELQVWAASKSVWSSGEVVTAQSFNIVYKGPALEDGAMYSWAVNVTSTRGESVTSSRATFSMGLLTRDSWSGQFIGLGSGDGVNDPWFRTLFELPQDGSGSALLYVASVGFCEATVNGHPVSDAVLSPSISYLPKRILYRTYDVTDLLVSGANNTIGLWAATGWADYADMSWAEKTAWGSAPLVLAELRVNNKVVAATDSETWLTRKSTTSRLGDWGEGGFGGDAIDERDNVVGWDTPHVVVDNTWDKATVYNVAANVTLSADVMEPTRMQETVAAIRIDTVPSSVASPSSYVVEMAELYTGWFQVSNLEGCVGCNVTFSVSTTSTTPLEFNMQDAITFGPSGKATFRMRFSYHEIHYITITGLSRAPSTSDVVGFRLFSSLSRTGHFSCSHKLISQVYDNTVYNYLGLTTGGQTVDCPHRERRGYGGDGHTSYQFALANFHVGAYFTKWARDFADVQRPSGDVPHTAPTVSGGGGPAWSGFVVTMPWEVYRSYGDTSLLQTMYPVMEAQLSFYANNTHADGLLHPWDSSMWDFLGDWITPHGSESNVTSPENLLFNNCYLHYITRLTARISAVLGYTAKAAHYTKAADSLAAAINKAFYVPSTGAYVDLLQTHLVMPLATGVVPDSEFDNVMQRLVEAIDVLGGHLDTGLTANYFMTKLFTEIGRNDLMFTITNQTTFPSYGFFIAQGYNAWPEDWNVKPCCGDGVSKMHGCYNGVGLWFVQGIAGLTVDASDPEYQLTVRAGVDTGDVEWATGERSALHGGIAKSSWMVQPGSFHHNVTVPGNSVARVMVPAANVSNVMEGGKPITNNPEIKLLGSETVNTVPYVVMAVESGEFVFSSDWSRSPSVL